MPQNSPTPPNPLTADLPVTQAQTHTSQPPSPLSSPSPAFPFPHGSPIQARSQSKARHAPRFPATQAQTRTSQLPSPLSSSLTNSPIPALRCSPSLAPAPKVKPGTPHAFPPRRHRPTRPSRPARYLPRSPAPPFPHISPIQALLPPKRSPTRPTLSHHAGTDSHGPAAQPAILAAHQFHHSRTSLQPR